MEFIFLLRAFRVHEIPIGPQHQSLEGENCPSAAEHSQNENTVRQEQYKKTTDDQYKSEIIYVIPYNQVQ